MTCCRLRHVEESIASECDHARRRGCVYCPTCGSRYAPQPKQRSRSFISWLFAPIEFVARIYTPVMATPELDVTANHQEICTGDPERIRCALGFLLELAPHARRLRPVIEALKKLATKYDATPSQVALNWLIHFHADTVVAIPGATKVSQAEQNVGAMKFMLAKDELQALDEASKSYL